MIARVATWAAVLALSYGGYALSQGWHNPLSSSSPVLARLPKASDGCGKDCK
jgi:hypothetical protein